MTSQELNRDVKRLLKSIQKATANFKVNESAYYAYIASEATKEFTRIYHADDTFESLNKASILIMIRLNVRHRFVPLHMFGINIKIG